MPTTLLSDNMLPTNEALVGTLEFWQSHWQKGLLLMLLYQQEMLNLMQHAGTLTPQVLFDEWSHRYGGGVPLDG